MGSAGVPSIIAEVETRFGPCTVIGTYPVPPVHSLAARSRNDQLAKLPRYVAAATSPVLLLGDLNTTPWSPYFRQLVRESGLLDSTPGYGVQSTWPSNNPFLLIPIDHCLFSPEIELIDRVVGPHAGSDHYPLIVDFDVTDAKLRK